jgi:hypothetical protein
MRRTIGYAMLAVPFVGAAVVAASKVGWTPVLIAFGVTAALFGWIALVSWLVSK